MSETAKTDKSSPKNVGDPPKINISLPEISELTQDFKDWKDVQLPIDILLLTVKDCEFLSCYHYVVDPFRSYLKGLGHVYFGSIGEDQDVKLKVALMKCSEGSKVPGGALTVVKNAVTQLRPKAVFSVGQCSGMNQESTKLGDVVVSEKLTTYSYQEVTNDGWKFCGFTTPVSRDIAELFRCAGHGWKVPLENPKERKVEVHCGEVLSGSELVQAEWRRNELVKSFPKAIAIETEAEGKFSFSFEVTVTVKSAQRDIWIYLYPGRQRVVWLVSFPASVKRCTGLCVNILDFRSRGLGSSPGLKSLCCSLDWEA